MSEEQLHRVRLVVLGRIKGVKKADCTTAAARFSFEISSFLETNTVNQSVTAAVKQYSLVSAGIYMKQIVTIRLCATHMIDLWC